MCVRERERKQRTEEKLQRDVQDLSSHHQCQALELTKILIIYTDKEHVALRRTQPTM